ncbi:39S ribosomal protein L38, mitochondrial [Orchesella cincta]|uniref:Large ribosomal subunit protein mL38 n=1 Tax=Orchesella cincta TaxID=48709 RepID=A0A1D2MP64_ORCCI|nr:39S ribosomal protein L38, mitochondrial [Orchesella cincta]
MSYTLTRHLRLGLNFVDKTGIRHRWIKRGKDPEIASSLAQKMAEWNKKDPEIDFRVDIGYRYTRPSRKIVLSERLKFRKELKSNIQLEKAAKNRTLTAPMDGVYQEWCATSAPFHIQETAEYFNVFDDLFGSAYFTPINMLDIRYDQGDLDALVHQGNLLQPSETSRKPTVTYNGLNDALYTLVLTTPDCHLTEEKAEYLHWMIGNIPGNDVSKGAEICDYLQPFPPRGIGFCRYVFVLYRQEKVIDFSKYKRPENCKNLAARTFSTYEFYRDLQDLMTPCGLAFFQAKWDSTLTDFFHNVLEMKEPWFEYDFPVHTLPPQKWIPFRKPFNLYLDKYKHPKELGEELLLEKLKEVHPFEKPPPPLKYPQSIPLPRGNPSWLNDDIKRRRARTGKWKYM